MLRVLGKQFQSELRSVWAYHGSRLDRSLIRAFTSNYPKPYTIPDGPTGINRAARLELAAAYRGLNMLGLNEGTSNHLSVLAPRANGNGELMLVFPEGLHWKEVTASNLVGLDKEGRTVEGEGEPETTASCIHLSIHKNRPDIRVIMHTHQPYVTALTLLEEMEIQPVHQNSLRFINQIVYDTQYHGVAYTYEEGERLARVLGEKHVLMMANHGVIVVASTVSMAFEMLYFLERAAMVQVLAMSTKQKLRKIPEEVIREMQSGFLKRAQKYADTFYYSIYRQLQKTQPDFEK